MIADNLKRIEELRYKISDNSFRIMKMRINGEPGNKIAELDSETNNMKLELANHLSLIQDAGYVYIFVNKNEIEKLKQEFARLSKEDKTLAFKGMGKGYEILQKSNSLLKSNCDKKEDISTLIISLPSDEQIVSKIKNVLEGYSEKEEFSLENSMAAKRISSLINSLGFFSITSDNKVVITRSELDQQSKTANSTAGSNINVPNILSQENEISPDVSEVLKEAVEEAKDTPSSEIKEKQDRELNSKEDLKPLEADSKTKLTSEDLQPSFTYKEVCEKLDEILNNYKMKRWVLGAFKDEEEKKQYEKVQITLVKLMRLKQEMEEKGEIN